LKKLEDAREQKLIGKSLQAKLNLKLLAKDVDVIKRLKLNLHQVLIVSSVSLEVSSEQKIEVLVADGHVCERCWNIFDHVHENGLCDRCHDVIGGK
jgi:isoleucyl-tRNA synthetase